MDVEHRYLEHTADGSVPIKAWTRGVAVEDEAMRQLRNVASLPIVGPWVAAMPDVHFGYGATVGSVIPTEGAIIPAAVGVDIGCGMMAARTTLTADRLPDDLSAVRSNIERAVPHGRTSGNAHNDRGAWRTPPDDVLDAWGAGLAARFGIVAAVHPAIRKSNHMHHLGTLGTGNHFIEVCLDEADAVWFMLHSGSRGVGNKIGRYFIELAKRDMGKALGGLPDRDLAYLTEGTEHFDDYVQAVGWAQDFAAENRRIMMRRVFEAVRRAPGIPPFQASDLAVNCHHNYVARERHQGRHLLVTRKGAVRAGRGELGIIPGSMGARSYIVRGRGSADSFDSCSHGAGRAMSRTEARRRFTLDDHARATEGVECRKDASVLDETPAAYKPIDDVMAAQADLVEVVHTLKQVVCVKG